MRKLFFCLIACAFVINSNAQELQYPKLKTQMDSVSFYLGVDIGVSLGSMDRELILDFVYQGLAEGFRLGGELDKTEIHNYLRYYYQEVQPAKKLVQVEEYLETVAELPNVQRTESGLLYEIINEGDMRYRAVEDEDGVEIIYTGNLPDGTEFDRNDDGVIFQLNRIIPGMAEGLKLVGKGGRIKLYIHPDLGYGTYGGGGIIPPQSVLIFDVTVLDAPEN
ncbi:MAG: FKBP-type peptidyl-prolyl cis-trans isomerase [Alistipes sp.]|nr:FKBP-type peptidyl-prolyl cis-trans isomerase [Alistipes sp.]